MKYKIKKTIAKYKIEEVVISLPKSNGLEVFRYTVSYKNYWWQRWRYILDPQTKEPLFFHGLYGAISALELL
jgi:hypothetical protein